MTNILMFLVGGIFGLGLTVSQMINPNKIIGFLDITGDWDASLLFVMLSAVIVTYLGYRFVLRKSKPTLSKQFMLPTKQDIDLPLIVGAALFGIGWGLSGYCPGPSITALGLGYMDPVYMVIGLIAGSLACRLI